MHEPQRAGCALQPRAVLTCRCLWLGWQGIPAAPPGPSTAPGAGREGGRRSEASEVLSGGTCSFAPWQDAATVHSS